MSRFKRIDTTIADLYIIEPKVYGDERGFFLESYSHRDFVEIGIPEIFVQDNHSKSNKGVLRGIHFQKKHMQDKLVRVINGSIYDVAVDLRKGSETFGHWFGIELSATNKTMLYVPQGFGHGFLSLEDNTEVIYKVTDYYSPENESGIIFNDKRIGIKWPIDDTEIILSDKDKKLMPLNNFEVL